MLWHQPCQWLINRPLRSMHWIVVMLSVLEILLWPEPKLSLCMVDLVHSCLDQLWCNVYTISHQYMCTKSILSFAMFWPSTIVIIIWEWQLQFVLLCIAIFKNAFIISNPTFKVFIYLKINKWLCIQNSKYGYHLIERLEFEYCVIRKSSKYTPKKYDM